MTTVTTSLSLLVGSRWRHCRRQLLHGGVIDGGHVHCEQLADGVLRRTDSLPREAILALFGLGAESGPAVSLKDDRKRSVFRVYLDQKSYILKRFHHLYRWQAVSPDQKSWLGAHRLHNGVACHAWYRRHDLREAMILYEDAGDCDLFMNQCLQMPPEKLNHLFAQAGKTLAQLHALGVFHADTKPGNFVFVSSHHEPEVKLIDTDDVRQYWMLSARKKARNLAQFLGCTKTWAMAVYPAAQLAFCNGYLQQLPAANKEMPSLMPKVWRAIISLYPNWESRNRQLWEKLRENLSASITNASS